MNVAVVDNGGQWTHKEWRILTYLGCNAEIISNTTSLSDLEKFEALVLSGASPEINLYAQGCLMAEIWPFKVGCSLMFVRDASFENAQYPKKKLSEIHIPLQS